MQHALLAAERSSCSRAHVGCVFARDGRILVTGYNGAPRGLPHCDHTCDCDLSNGVTPRGNNDDYGGHDEFCNSRRGCTISVHAEANAVAFAAKHGVMLEGSELYCTLTPCIPCAQLIVNVGVVRVYVLVPYRIPDGEALLRTAGIEVIDCGKWGLL